MEREIIVVKVKKAPARTISRNIRGEGVVKCDSDAASIIDTYLARYPGISIKSLVSGMIKYIGENALVVEEE